MLGIDIDSEVALCWIVLAHSISMDSDRLKNFVIWRLCAVTLTASLVTLDRLSVVTWCLCLVEITI